MVERNIGPLIGALAMLAALIRMGGQMAKLSAGSAQPSLGMPNWDAVENRLRQERQRKLPDTDTSRAIREFRLAWKAAMAAGPERKPTGLVEQQTRFSSLRNSTAK